MALLFPTPERGMGVTEMEFVTGAAEAALEQDYYLMLSPSELRNVRQLDRLTGQGLIDGALVMEVRLHDERVDLLRQAGLPFSMIGRPSDPGSINYADIDFEQTTRDAVAHLKAFGHRCIGFLSHSPSAFSVGYGPTVRAADGFRRAARSPQLVVTLRDRHDDELRAHARRWGQRRSVRRGGSGRGLSLGVGPRRFGASWEASKIKFHRFTTTNYLTSSAVANGGHL